MENAEGADDRVKARRIEREVFGIALAKFDPRVAASRLSDHVRREIDADRVRATRGGAVGNVARSAGHIEDAHASANASGIKQRRDGADRDLAGNCIVIVGLGAPALLLKFLKARCVRYSALRHRVVSHVEESEQPIVYARAASGHATAAPLSATSNSRRPMVTVIRPSRARCAKGRIPRHERAVFTFTDPYPALHLELSNRYFC